MSDLSPNSASAAVVPNRDMARGELAAWLRDARERSGLSIDAVSQETRISKTYILSLESGNLDGLPGKVFGRGFVKNITRLLRTDTSEGLRLYDACWSHSVMTPATDASKDQPAPSNHEVHKTKTVQARITEPVNISSPVAKRLMTTDFPQAGEKARLPRSEKFLNKNLSIKMPEWLVHSFVSPQIRLWVLAGFATIFVGLVFGRWAAGTLHKGRLSSKSQMTSAALPIEGTSTSSTQGAGHSVVDSDNTAIELESSPTAISGADQAMTRSAGDAAAKAVQVSKLMDQSNPVLGSNADSRTVAADEDNPLYMPSASGAVFEQILEFKVAGDVDIKLTIDGNKIERTKFATDAYRFSFNDRAEIYLGDASMVDVIYNGKSLGVLGGKGRKRRIFLQAKATSGDFPQ